MAIAQVGGKFLLWEAALNLKADPLDSSEFLAAVKDCFEEGSAAEVLDLSSNDEFKDVIGFVGWEVIGIVIPFLDQFPSQEHYEKILEKLCETCNPKEVFLAITDILHEVSSLHCLQCCINNLQRAIMRINKKRKKFVKIGCGKVSRQIDRFSLMLVTECESDNEEKTNCDDLSRLNLLDSNTGDDELPHKSTSQIDESEELENNSVSDNDVIKTRFCCLVDSGLDFIKPFIDEVGTTSQHGLDDISDEERDVKTVLMQYLCHTLIHHLSLFEVFKPDKESPFSKCFACMHTSMTLAEKTVECIFSLNMTFTELMKYNPVSITDEESDGRVSKMIFCAKAVLAYLIFVKGIGVQYYPFILRSEFLLHLLMKPIVHLMAKTDGQKRKIALVLAENLMTRCSETSLSHLNLLSDDSIRLFKGLIDVMIHETDDDLRNQALNVFKSAIQRYELNSRLEIYRELLTKISHPGASGLIIQFIKDDASKFDPKNYHAEIACIYETFTQLLRIIFDPLTQQDLDIQVQSDRIIAALNLLRFLLLRTTPTVDEFGIMKDFSKIESDFLDPLRKNVELAHAENLFHLKEAETEMNSAQQSDENSNQQEELLSVATVDGANLKQSSTSQKVQTIQLALNTFDIIRSLLARISEIHREKELGIPLFVEV